MKTTAENSEFATSPAQGNAETLVPELIAFIQKHRLESPALFLLEIARPLTTFWKVGGIVTEPFGHLLFGRRFFDEMVGLLADPNQLENLMKQLEERAA